MASGWALLLMLVLLLLLLVVMQDRQSAHRDRFDLFFMFGGIRFGLCLRCYRESANLGINFVIVGGNSGECAEIVVVCG
jgi:hypothetical protein